MSQSSSQKSEVRIQNSEAGSRKQWLMVAILLIAAAFRFLALDAAPPGWRDDELIEFNMDRRIADGWRPLFIAEAEGHEPMYHYLHAGTLLLFGDNLVGYKWLPLACGLLTIALTFALSRKLFDGRVALLGAALLAVSFWPIMYSRFGVRHIGTLPWMLIAFYLLYPGKLTPENTAIHQRKLCALRGVFAGICLAAGLMTYFAGRAVPVVLAGFLAYLLIFHRSLLRRVGRRYALAGVIALALAAPMFIEIARTPGAEQRTEIVGGPLIELRRGNAQPAIETTLGTLGMFTFAGDPESLYNVPGRPVFDGLTGAFFYLGVLVCLVRLKRVESGFALAWLVIGIAPAFVSVPAASFSHTIVALPVVYVLAAVGVVGIVDKETGRQGNKAKPLSTYLLISLSTLLIGLNGWLTLRDYFGTWASDWLVQFQYHAPTREMAQWLDQTPQMNDVAIGTHPNQLALDPIALQLDLRRSLSASWFNAESALILPPGRVVLFSALQPMGDSVREFVATYGQSNHTGVAFTSYVLMTRPLRPVSDAQGRPQDVPPLGGNFDQQRLKLTIALRSTVTARPGQSIEWRTFWQIVQPLSIARAKLFLHVLNDRNEVVIGNDREDLNFATVQAGDEFWQISALTLPLDLAPGPYAIELGWYNPETGERLQRDDGSDRFLLPPLAVIAP